MLTPCLPHPFPSTPDLGLNRENYPPEQRANDHIIRTQHTMDNLWQNSPNNTIRDGHINARLYTPPRTSPFGRVAGRAAANPFAPHLRGFEAETPGHRIPRVVRSHRHPTSYRAATVSPHGGLAEFERARICERYEQPWRRFALAADIEGVLQIVTAARCWQPKSC